MKMFLRLKGLEFTGGPKDLPFYRNYIEKP